MAIRTTATAAPCISQRGGETWIGSELLQGRRNGHVVDHAPCTADVGGEFGDERLFSQVPGNATDRDDAIDGSDLGDRAKITSPFLAGPFARRLRCSLLTDPLAGYARRSRLADGQNSCAIKGEVIFARSLGVDGTG